MGAQSWVEMRIICDSREQCGYAFPDHETKVSKLDTGDYSICGLEDHISIERKGLGDLINCLSHDRQRFEAELYRGKSLDYFALVVEASLSDIANGSYRSRMTPASAIQSLVSFSVRYRLPVWFCGSREYGQRVTESLLTKYAREIQKRYEAIT